MPPAHKLGGPLRGAVQPSGLWPLLISRARSLTLGWMSGLFSSSRSLASSSGVSRINIGALIPTVYRMGT